MTEGTPARARRPVGTSRMLSVRLYGTTIDALDRAAAKRGVSRSEFVERALHRVLEGERDPLWADPRRPG